MIGDVWEWTASPYVAYPRLSRRRPARSANTTASSCRNQMVLRGGCGRDAAPTICGATYRNFFPPDARWAFSGLRLAEDL